MDTQPDSVDMSNPFNQSFILFDSLGDQFEVHLSDLDVYVHNGITTSIVLASQIGASLAILLVLLILTKSEKRCLPVFLLNGLALLLTFIYSILRCLYYTGPWYSPYAYLSGDYTFVPRSAIATSVTTEIFAFLIELCLELSLVLQVHVVCATLERKKRALVMVVSALVALLAIGFRLAQVVLNIQINIIMAASNLAYAWVAQARDITLTISICFFSIIFCLKLGWAMYQRRLLGLKQFGPMQIIFIGGTQTLILPVICAILQFVHPTFRASTLILTVTAISLPLTSLWASASVERPDKAARGPDAHRKFLIDTSAASASMRQPSHVESGIYGTSAYQASGRDRFQDSASAVEKDLELQELGRAR
ncbi:hypothetical protein MBLNU457_6840t1 [Dothideomycetes sp. NU457]